MSSDSINIPWDLGAARLSILIQLDKGRSWVSVFAPIIFCQEIFQRILRKWYLRLHFFERCLVFTLMFPLWRKKNIIRWNQCPIDLYFIKDRGVISLFFWKWERKSNIALVILHSDRFISFSEHYKKLKQKTPSVNIKPTRFSGKCPKCIKYSAIICWNVDNLT